MVWRREREKEKGDNKEEKGIGRGETKGVGDEGEWGRRRGLGRNEGGWGRRGRGRGHEATGR